MIGLLIFRYYHKNLEVNIDENMLTPSDYTILANNIPIDKNEEEIRAFFNEIDGGNKKVAGVVMAYYIGEYIDKQRVKQRLEFKNTKLLNQQRNGKDVSEDLREIEMKIKEIDKELKTLGDEFEQGSLRFTGTAFITFQEESEASKIGSEWQMGDWEYLLCSCCSSHKFEGHVLQIKQAPEPTDVLWENWGYSKVYLLGQRIATQFYTILLLGVCFAIIIGISYAQDSLKKQDASSLDPTNTILSLLSSLFILIINFIIIIVAKKFVSFEKHGTFTNFNVSVAKKIGLAQFINTALVTAASNAIIHGRDIYVDGGLLYDVQYILLLNSFVPLLFQVFKIFQGPPFDPALKYAAIIKTLLTTAFYAPFLPVGLIFGIGSLIIQYWLDKYLLLRRYAKPQNLGAELSNAMMDFFMEIVLIAYALGCWYSEYVMYEKISVGTLITLIFSGVYFLLPMDKIFVEHIKLCSCKLEKDFTQRTYDEVKNEFFTAYDRTNPATMAQAMNQWIKQLAQEKTGEQIQPQKPTTRLNAFNFYAQMKQGLQQQLSPFMQSQSYIQPPPQQQQQFFNPMFRQQMVMNMMQPQNGIMRNAAMQQNQMNMMQRNQYFNQMRMQQFMPMMQRPQQHHPSQHFSQQFSKPINANYNQVPSQPMNSHQMIPRQPSQPLQNYPMQQPQQQQYPQPQQYSQPQPVQQQYQQPQQQFSQPQSQFSQPQQQFPQPQYQQQQPQMNQNQGFSQYPSSIPMQQQQQPPQMMMPQYPMGPQQPHQQQYQ